MPFTPSPLRRALLAFSLSTLAFGAQAQAWPSKPVKILVGFPAGASPDLVARTLAEPLSLCRVQRLESQWAVLALS